MRTSTALKLVDEPIEEKGVEVAEPADRDAEFDFDYFQYYVLGVRTLWIEVIRRAAFDWVLYKNSQRMPKRLLAQDAYNWLFVEDQDHPNWAVRVKTDGCTLSSFIGICEALGLDPDTIRLGILHLTSTKIKTLGKLPMRRSKGGSTAEHGHDDLEFRMSCAADAAKFIQEIKSVGTLFDDGKDLDW
jgi:hypothetical protein